MGTDNALKILLVDDSMSARMLLKQAFPEVIQKRAQFFEASDGLQCLELFKTVQPHIVFLDLTMPNMNGLELVKKVRAEAKYADMPIIMVTTEGGKTEVITALKAGVNNYIVKPFTPQVLKEKLEAVLGISKG